MLPYKTDLIEGFCRIQNRVSELFAELFKTLRSCFWDWYKKVRQKVRSRLRSRSEFELLIVRSSRFSELFERVSRRSGLPVQHFSGGFCRTLDERWPKLIFVREEPKYCAAAPAASRSHFAFSSRYLLDWAKDAPNGGWSDEGCPCSLQPGRNLAEPWCQLLKLQLESAAATVVWLKLPTTRGIQDFIPMHNLHNLAPPRRNLSRACSCAAAQRYILSLYGRRMFMTSATTAHSRPFQLTRRKGHHKSSRNIMKHRLQSSQSSRACVHSSNIAFSQSKRFRPR